MGIKTKRQYPLINKAMLNDGRPVPGQQSKDAYQDWLITQFESLANSPIRGIRPGQQLPAIMRPTNTRLTLRAVPYTKHQESSKPQEMNYFGYSLTYKKRSFCGFKKIELDVVKIQIEPGSAARSQLPETGSPVDLIDAVLTTASGEKLLVSQISRQDFECIEADLDFREANRLLSVKSNSMKLRAMVLVWRSQYHETAYQSMIHFNTVYEEFDRELKEQDQSIPELKDEALIKGESQVEHYSEIVVRINEEKEMIMDPAIRSPGESVDNYNTVKVVDPAKFLDIDRETMGKEKYQNKLESQRKTNFQNLTDFKDTKEKPATSLKTGQATGHVSVSMAASHHPQGSEIAKKNLSCQMIACVVLGLKFKSVWMSLEVTGVPPIPRRDSKLDMVKFNLAQEKFSETPMTHIYKPDNVVDLSKIDDLKRGMVCFDFIGKTEEDQDLKIGTNIVLLSDLFELFESFNHNVVSFPMMKQTSNDACRAVLILTKKPMQDIERFSNNLEDGLFNELVKSPQFEIFSRNSMTQFNYNSGEMRPPALQASSPFFPVQQSKVHNNFLDPIDLTELLTNQKLRSLVWDTLQYRDKTAVARLCSKTEDYLKLAILSRPEHSRTMNQSVIMNKSAIYDLARSKILSDIRNVQQEDLKLEVFDLRLSDSFLTNWAIIERAENFHKRMWMMLSPGEQISFQRFKKVDILKIRLQIMNQLFYNILRDYYHKPSFISGKKVARESFRTGFEHGDDTPGSASLTNHPMFMTSLRGLSKDYFLLMLFVIENCPLLSRKISLDWQSSVLVMLPKILDILSDLLTHHRFVSLLDKLFGGDLRLKSRSHTLVQLVCIALQSMELRSASSCWMIEESSDSFEANFRSFIQIHEEEIFQEYELQLQENHERQLQGQRNLFSNILVSIQEAVTHSNTLAWLDNATKNLQNSKTISSFTRYNSITNSVAMKLLDISQSLRMNGSQLLALISRPEEETNWRVFVQVAGFSRGRSSPEVRDGTEVCHVLDIISDSLETSFKLKLSLGSLINTTTIHLTKERAFALIELTVAGVQSVTLTTELIQTDPFDLFREVAETQIGRVNHRLDILKKDQVHLIELRMHHPNNFYEEYWIRLNVLVTSYSTLQNVKDESFMYEVSDKSQVKDPFALERKVLFEGDEGIEAFTVGNLLADELTAANYVQNGPYKMNISTVEAVTSRRCFNHLSRVYRINPSTAAAYNYFKNSYLFQERSISYMDIVKNLSRMEEVENVRIDPTMQNITNMGSLSLLLRMLIFNDDTDMLINCLVSYFGRDNKTLMACDLVLVYSKLLEIVHLKPHMIEVCDYLSSQLDGLDLRPKLMSLTCVLCGATPQRVLSKLLSDDGKKFSSNSEEEFHMFDLTKTVNEIFFWLSFNNNCPKLILGDSSSLFIVQELVSTRMGAISPPSDNNFVKIVIEHNSHRFTTVIPFDRYYRPTAPVGVLPEIVHSKSSPSISKPQLAVVFDMETFAVDLRPLTSLAVNRVDLFRLFQAANLAAYVRDLSKF